MNNQMDDMVKRTYRYFYVDGLVEAATGLLFLLIGLVLLGWINLEEGGWVQITAVIALPIVILGGTFFIKYVVNNLKERITYQRTGYVAYREDEPAKGRWIVIALAFAMPAILLLLPDSLNSMSTMQGALLGVILAAIGYRVSVTRFYVFGAIAFTIGVTVAFVVQNEILGSVITFAVTGGAMFLLGIIVFLNYLRQHPRIHQEPM